MDILKFKASDPNFFEMIVGTEDGKIFLGAVDTNTGEP
jgi:hypothetical protein